jgi:putative transposase
MLFFGKVVNTEIELSKLGRVAYKYWEEIPEDHEGVDMDEFVIMPNHIHGIVFLPPKTYVNPPFDTVETLHATSLQSNVSRKMSKISPRKGSLSVVIRSNKIGSYPLGASKWL